VIIIEQEREHAGQTRRPNGSSLSLSRLAEAKKVGRNLSRREGAREGI